MDVSTTDTTGALSSIRGHPPDAGGERRRDAIGSIGPFVTPGRDVTHGMKTELAMRLNDLVELQSARLAGVLHDEASQILASAHLAIADISRDASPPLQARLREVRLHLDEVAEQLRRISHELHPSILDDLGGIDAIKFIAREFARRTGIRVAITVHLDEPCPATVGATVYRFVQEALTNIDEHAQAAFASIVIAREGSRLLGAVSDDGVGFDVAATLAGHASHGLGLRLIRSRLEAIGGTLDITSARQQGTLLRAILPLEI